MYRYRFVIYRYKLNIVPHTLRTTRRCHKCVWTHQAKGCLYSCENCEAGGGAVLYYCISLKGLHIGKWNNTNNNFCRVSASSIFFFCTYLFYLAFSWNLLLTLLVIFYVIVLEITILIVHTDLRIVLYRYTNSYSFDQWIPSAEASEWIEDDWVICKHENY